MSFYRSLLAAVAAAALISPVFAADEAQPNSAQGTEMQQQASSDQSTMQKVNLNKASAKELMKVKGLNAAKARAIVAYRKKHGDFKSTDDLMNVKGFKKMKSETVKEIQDQLSVE